MSKKVLADICYFQLSLTFVLVTEQWFISLSHHPNPSTTFILVPSLKREAEGGVGVVRNFLIIQSEPTKWNEFCRDWREKDYSCCQDCWHMSITWAWRDQGSYQQKRRLGTGNERLLTPSPVLGMYILPTVSALGTTLKMQPWESIVLLRTCGWYMWLNPTKASV